MLEIYIGLIVVFVYIFLYIIARVAESNLLDGIWFGTQSFLDSADLHTFTLYMSDRNLFSRNAYMLVSTYDDVLLNLPIEISLTSTTLIPFIGNRSYSVSIDWCGVDVPEELFPSELDAEYYPYYQRLVLHKDGEIKAILCKDTEVTCMRSESPLIPDELMDNHATSRIA